MLYAFKINLKIDEFKGDPKLYLHMMSFICASFAINSTTVISGDFVGLIEEDLFLSLYCTILFCSSLKN